MSKDKQSSVIGILLLIKALKYRCLYTLLKEGREMKYVKNPIEIEAFQWFGSIDQTEDPLWAIEAIKNGKIRFQKIKEPVMIIRTLKGDKTARHGDYIIKDSNGEIYPCKRDIFIKTYSPLYI